MAELVYYPGLVDILPIELIPEQAGFIKSEIEKVLSDVFYGNYTREQNQEGDKVFQTLNLILLEQFGLTIPGTSTSSLKN